MNIKGASCRNDTFFFGTQSLLEIRFFLAQSAHTLFFLELSPLLLYLFVLLSQQLLNLKIFLRLASRVDVDDNGRHWEAS